MALMGFNTWIKVLVLFAMVNLVLVMIGNSYISLYNEYSQKMYYPYTPSSRPKNIATFPASSVKPYYLADNKKKFENQPSVRQMCSSSVWRQNIYVDCFRNLMGTFNAINRVQVCIRWAIDAGIGIIHPQLWKRGTDLITISDLTYGKNNLDFILDEEFLWKALKLNCPQLHVAKSEELHNIVEIHTQYIMDLKNQLTVGEYRTLVDKLISDYKSNNSVPLIEDKTTIVIKQWDSLSGWKVWLDPLPFQIAFKELFLFQPSIIQLALGMLYKLPKNFMGVHFRAEADWLKLRPHIGEPILDKVEDRGLEYYPVIYVACGEIEALNRFTNLAGERGMQIATKWSIADADETIALQKLEFDQLAVVDYIILHHATYFYGDGLSSFSFALANTRHLEQYGNLNYTFARDEDQYLLGDLEKMFVNNRGLW